MSSTPRKITRYKWTTWINDMPKVELAIGSILVTIEHKQSDTHLEYQDLPYFRIAHGTFWIVPIPSSGSLKSFSIWSISESPPFQRECAFIQPPAHFRQSFASCTCSWFKIFLLRQNNPVYKWGPLVCLPWVCPSGPKPCRGSKSCISLAKQKVSFVFHPTKGLQLIWVFRHMTFLKNEAQINKSNFGRMLFMGKQVNLPKISSILQKMKPQKPSINCKRIYIIYLTGIFSPIYGSCFNTSMILSLRSWMSLVFFFCSECK